MRRLALIFPLVSLLALACGEKKTPDSTDTNGTDESLASGEAALLDLGSLYDPQEILATRSRANDSLKKQSHQRFLAGADLLINQEDAKGSIALFEQSLQLYPEARTYFELGVAYRKLSRHEEALKAYGAAEFLDYQPKANLLFEQSCSLLSLDKKKEGLKTLEAALKEGYADRERFLNEAAILTLAETDRNELYLKYLKDKNNPKQAYFELFVKGFPEGKLPFGAKLSELEKLIDLENRYISWDFHTVLPAMENAEFAREVSEEFAYIAKLGETENYVLVAYGAVYHMGWEPTHFVRLATYNRKGEQIDEVELSSNIDPYEHKEGRIDASLKVTVTAYANKWARDYDEYGPKDNKINERRPKTPQTYRLTSKGEFVKMLGS